MIISQEAGPTSPDRLALVGIDGHIYVQRADGSLGVKVTWNVKELSYGVWNLEESPDRLRYFWPTWSPRGDRIACLGTFGQAGHEQGTGIYVLDAVEGVQAWDVWTGTSSSPIYLSWAPEGERLAFVLQQQEALSLALADLQRLGEPMPLLTGVPLFHRFSPDGRSMAIHLGGRFNGEPGRRLYHIDLATPDRRLTITEKPGLFGTPSWSPDGAFLAFTVSEGDMQALCLVDHPRRPHRRLGQFQGVGALLWSHDGQRLMVAVAPAADQTTYDQLWSYPIDGGTPELLLGERFVACFPADADRLVYVKPGSNDRELVWRELEPGGRSRPLATFYPSQPQLFMLHFFHQYGHSHRLISPGGRQLICAGYPTRAEMDDDHTLPSIFLIDLDREGPPTLLAEGSIACWAPAEATVGSS